MHRLATLTLFGLLTCACQDSSPSNSNEIIQVDAEDVEMNAAIEEARATLDTFLTEWSADPDEFPGLLKVYFTDSDGPNSESDGEHMWVTLMAAEDDAFEGTLLSSPGWLTSVKQGDVVTFGRGDITDWVYAEDGKAKGAFTVQLLRTRMNPEERAAHDANYPFSFD